MVEDRVQCMAGSQMRVEGVVVSPSLRQPKKETRAVAHTAAWRGSSRFRWEWRECRCSRDMGGRMDLLYFVPSFLAAFLISCRRSVSPCQGAWW